MESFDSLIRVDVIGHQIIVGRQLHAQDLSKRIVYTYRNRVVVKANMAHIMLR
jgi:hypothetical protein